MATRVVNRRSGEPFDVYVGRPSIWGNPYKIGRDGDRDTVLAAYRRHVRSRPDLLRQLLGLRGKVLACWCTPLPCHADILAEMADDLL